MNILKYSFIVVMVCACAIIFCGCEKKKPTFIDTTHLPNQPYKASKQGRVVKLGDSKPNIVKLEEHKTSKLGPSFDFDKLNYNQ